ncbi:MAG: hypothetical protein ACOX8B_02910 [Lachnospiraceae bacterium]|jgi:hypothetical protein
MSILNEVLSGAHEDYSAGRRLESLPAETIGESAEIIAVYHAGDSMRLWQSCYRPAEEVHAEHVWILAGEKSVHLRAEGAGGICVSGKDRSVECGGPVSLREFRGYPDEDVLGNHFGAEIGNFSLTKTLAAFYWHTLIPCVIEGKNEDYPDGYVLSTLAQSVYAGTYPDVDHEFQIKGRIACGDQFDLQLIRRMIELQLKLMEEDPVKLWRDPCALQPNGNREYHVRRNSGDGKTNADMFLITGNVEVLESVWLLTARTGDLGWLGRQIEKLEGAASLTELCMDPMGRLWSDVFYEDQIIKDGMECMSACLAAHSFHLLAELENELGRIEKAQKYSGLEKTLAEMLRRPVPYGFWDEKNRHFIDWLDRDGAVHDHLHLLANCLPVVFHYCSSEQEECCRKLIQQEFDEFQRFPTFLSPRVGDYTPSEIGVPYDLCAAGRYWCWDAAYWAALGRPDVIVSQLEKVAGQAEADHYEMGERYDMNYIYYQDDKNWHGAERYYEYPCVFWWVTVRELGGIRPSLHHDLQWVPQKTGGLTIELQSWNVRCHTEKDQLSVRNLSDSRELDVEIDPSHFCAGGKTVTLRLRPGEEKILTEKDF